MTSTSDPTLHHRHVTAADAVRARGRLTGGGTLRTPLVSLGSNRPFDVRLKLENLQPVGSFKIRGMANAVSALVASAPSRDLTEGVWTLSAGNAAQGLAWAARAAGIRCTVVVPDTAAATKLRAVERLEAEIRTVPLDDWFQYAGSRSVPGMEGVLVHPFSDSEVMAGNGTVALEILEDVPDVAAVVVPWGGGGLCCGIASVLRDVAPGVRVFAAEVETAAPLRAGLAARHPVDVPVTPSFVDGIGAPRTFPEMLELALELVDDSIVVPLDDVASAVRLLAERNHVVAEGAGATAVAAALTGRAGDGPVVAVVSGGNIDADKLALILTDVGGDL